MILPVAGGHRGLGGLSGSSAFVDAGDPGAAGLDRARLFGLLRRHTKALPRYTSYPTVPYWDADFGEADYVEALDEAGLTPERPLSVYVHLPFCGKRCYYCGCNAVAGHRPEVVDRYLDRLEWEIEGVVDRVGSGRPVTQLHWGGGTPNFLTDAQTVRLFEMLARAFHLQPDAEISIEMDPRVATPSQPPLLKSLGFNRLSMGVQDFDHRVQVAIGRVQPESETVALLEGARAAGFESVNFDLVYGLPYQTSESFARTLKRVVELAPERIATFSYAHLPHVRRIQQAVDASGLPEPREKLGLFLDTVDAFEGAGYQWIGFDHFAHPDDELSVAARERRLLRNFMGYTTHAAPDQVAFGMSGIGCIAGRFVQNDAGLKGWEESLEAGHFPIVRGHRISEDDRMRSHVIQHLMCNLELPENLTTEAFGAPLSVLLADDLPGLAPYVDEGFLDETDRGWSVTTMGRFFLRNVASVFDPYLDGARDRPTFSSTV
jgi:oxygen-independent coproporphyrinogen-3 oxidase